MGAGKIIVIILALIILFAASGTYWLLSSPTVEAQLHVEAGTVSVNGKPVIGTVPVEEGDIIETKDGMATVILYETIFVSLEPQTKIKLDDLTKKHPVLKQDTGTTWNQFIRGGDVPTFSIKSGQGIATVQGTSFGLSAARIITGEGTVSYRFDNKVFVVSRLGVAEWINGNMVERPATPDEITAIKRHFERTLRELIYTRSIEINKHWTLVEVIKNRFHLTDQDIRQGLEDIDQGRKNVDELAAQSPVRPTVLGKLVRITKAIQQITADLKQL